MTDIQSASTTASNARRSAWAKYEVVRRGCALVTIDYLGADDLWSMFRIELRSPDVVANGVDPLYEEAYRLSVMAARVHGYELDRFSTIEPPAGVRRGAIAERERLRRRTEFEALKSTCGELVVLPLQRRPANALNIEIGQPLDRCRQRTPPDWGDVDPRAARWIYSGGSPMILGVCGRARCPKMQAREAAVTTTKKEE